MTNKIKNQIHVHPPEQLTQTHYTGLHDLKIKAWHWKRLALTSYEEPGLKLGAGGVETIIEITLTEEEKTALMKSADAVQELKSDLGKLM